MSKNFDLSLTMRLRDLASRGVLMASRDMQSAIGKTATATDNLTKAVTNYGKKREAISALGIRSEHEIQREIQRTEAAYNRLGKSGETSFREQARAAQALKTRLRELNSEMGKYSLAQRAAGGMRAGASVVAGAMAGGYVLSKPVERTMDYGMRLAQMSNTAYTDRDTAGRIAGKRELNAAIVNAVRVGGGTRDSAAETLDSIIASGAMSPKDAMSMLPTLMKASTASGADSKELAQIGIRGMQTFGIKAGDMGNIIDMAITAGQAGGFELKDMAKWLPQQMAAAKVSGMSGTAGMSKLLAANQATAITAGTKDEAGNNLVNLLAKINSQDTAKDAQKLGINLSGTLSAARGKGIDSLDAFVGIVDHVVGKDKNYQALQGRLKTAKGEDKRAVLESQADILQGSAIGGIIQDRQALMALVGIMGNRDYMADVQKKTLAGSGATDKNFAVIQEEAGFKVQQASNEKEFATTAAFEKLTPLVGSVADGFSAIAKEYPALTAATVAATTALTALAAAAGASALTNAVGGGKGGLLSGVLSKGKGLLTAGGALLARGGTAAIGSGGALLARAGGFLLGGAEAVGGAVGGTALAGVGAAGAVGYGGGSLLYDHGIKATDAGFDLGGTLATMMSWFGSEEADRALKIELHMDGQPVYTMIRKRGERTASRH